MTLSATLRKLAIVLPILGFAAPGPAIAQSDERARVEGLVDTAGPFTIQLGAFSTEPRSSFLVTDAREEDLDVRVVRVEGSELVRVRLGGFLSRDLAEGRAREIRGLGFEAVVSSDRDEEIPVH